MASIELSLRRLLRDRRGVSAIEYAFLLVAILLLVAGAYRLLGKRDGEAARAAELTITASSDWTPGTGNGDQKTGCDGRSCGGDGTCFVAGTLVATPSGQRTIESLREGDLVLARGEADETVAARSVVRTFVRGAPALVDVRLVTVDGERESIRSTPEHPYFTRDRGWSAAGELAAGETLVDRSGREVRVTNVVPIAQEAAVYNLEVEGDHTYFVGRTAVWVHNTCDPAGTTPPGTTPPGATPPTGPVPPTRGGGNPAWEKLPSASSEAVAAENAAAKAEADAQKAAADAAKAQKQYDNLKDNPKVPDDKKATKKAEAEEAAKAATEAAAEAAKAKAKADSMAAEAEAAHVATTLGHIDNGTVPPAPLDQKWGDTFHNNRNDLPTKLPGEKPYKEYRVQPGLGEKPPAGRRIVVDTETGAVYYTRTHYGDHGPPAFVRIR